MKSPFAGLLVVTVVALTGCDGKDSPGGPGATNPTGKQPLYGQADNTFNLSAPSTTLKQGETKAVSIAIKRGTNFQDDVALKFADVPQGVTFDPASPVIKHGDKATEVTLKAAADASLGDFKVKLTGHPTKGGDGSTEFKITVTEDKDVAAKAAKAKRDEYARDMHKQLDELDAKYEELKTSAAKAEGQAKKDLEKKLEEAKVKRDAAAKKLDELKEAEPERWEKIKDGVGNAFDDLKKVFK
jgi:DNA primase